MQMGIRGGAGCSRRRRERRRGRRQSPRGQGGVGGGRGCEAAQQVPGPGLDSVVSVGWAEAQAQV